MEIGIDWLACTFRNRSAADVAALVADVCDDWENTYGLYGYKASMKSEGMRVMYDGRPGMGVMLEVSGVGCNRIMCGPNWKGWHRMVRRLRGAGGKFTRIDVSYDWNGGEVDLNRVESDVVLGSYQSGVRDVSVQCSYSSRRLVGKSIYVGAFRSDVYLCFYDKQLELVKKGGDDVGPWVRGELRYKAEAAEALASSIVTQIGVDWLSGVLFDFVRFFERGDDGVPATGVTARWWVMACGSSVRARVGVAHKAATVNGYVKQYVDRAGVMSAVLEAAGSLEGVHVGAEEAALIAGRRRLSRKHVRTIEELRQDLRK